MLSHLEEPETVWDDLSLKTLAGIAGLSPSRFMHAFTESVGVPVRPYILWLRLQRAACDLKMKPSVARAAPLVSATSKYSHWPEICVVPTLHTTGAQSAHPAVRPIT